MRRLPGLIGNEFFRTLAVVLATGAAMAPGSSARAGGISFTDFSLVTIGVKGDPTKGNVSTQSDVTGSAFISGSIQGAFTVAQDLPMVPHPSTSPVYGLDVLGNINSGVNVNSGYSVMYAGTKAGGVNVNLNGGGLLTRDTGGVLASEQQSLYNQVTRASAAFAGLASVDAVVSNADVNKQHALTFTYSGPAGGVAVFDLTASELKTGNLNLYLNQGGASSVVFNVTGANGAPLAVASNINFSTGFSDSAASKILWNFDDVNGQLNLGSRTWIGSVLAPTGIIGGGNGDIDGSVFVEALSTNGEVHYKNNGHVVQYDGFNPISVPEPSSIVMAALGMLGVGLAGWRARRRAS